MNKADKRLIIIIILSALLWCVPLVIIHLQTQNKIKDVVVNYKNNEVLRAPLTTNKTYQIKGTLGNVKVEVKAEKVRVEKENSPYHLCSIQGWVSQSSYPIVCLPNDVVVQIEATNDATKDDVVIQ